MRKDFYVYLYWRLDINEPFYVGKGCGDRWRRLNKRSDNFKKIVNKHPIAVEIIKDNLTEHEAFYWEEKIIDTMVFEYSYSININKNRSKEQSLHLVNSTWGGEGVSGNNWFKIIDKDTKEKWIEAHKGLKPMLGKRHTEESKEKISKATKGENNPSSKSVYIIELDMTFDTITECAKYLNCSKNNISNVLRGKSKTAKGYHIIYAEYK